MFVIFVICYCLETIKCHLKFNVNHLKIIISQLRY